MSINPNDLPRDSKREATPSSRGYIKQFVRALIILLESSRETEVYIETFEDILKVLRGELTAEQVKERTGIFSITTKDACLMLNAWAGLEQANTNVKFVYCSTQTAGNTFDSKDAFSRWASGENDSSTLTSIQNTLHNFLTRDHLGEFTHLQGVTGDATKFKAFWEKINWMLGAPNFSATFAQVVSQVESKYNREHGDAERQALVWLGVVASTTSANSGTPKGLTLQYLEGKSADGRFAEVAIALLELEQQHQVDIATILTNIQVLRDEFAKAIQVIVSGQTSASVPSITDSADQLKAYTDDLIDAKMSIKLQRFLEKITAETVGALDKALPIDAGYSPAEIARRIDTSATEVTPLVSVLLHLIKTAPDMSIGIVGDAIKELAEHALNKPKANDHWYKLGLESAIIAFYCCNTLLVYRKNYIGMKALTDVEIHVPDRGNEPLRSVLMAYKMLTSNVGNEASEIPGANYGKETTANWIVFKKVQPIIREHIRNEDALNQAFDEMEVLLSLLYVPPFSNSVDAPRPRSHVDRKAVDLIKRLKADEDEVGYNKWGPLQAGFWLDETQYYGVRNRIRDYWIRIGY